MRQIFTLVVIICLAYRAAAQQDIAWFYKVTKTKDRHVYLVAWRAVVPVGFQVKKANKLKGRMISCTSKDWETAGPPVVDIVADAGKRVGKTNTVMDFSQPFRWTSKKRLPVTFNGVFRFEASKSGDPIRTHSVAFQSSIL